ncbi:MAG TPA: sigma-70 family RNA polymerase sigma factor [Terracidiphilus sp.]
MKETQSISAITADQDILYADAIDQYGDALNRLVRAYEADPEKRRDLGQDIHFQLWRSFQRYDTRCSLRTWIYRVAHNVGASHILRERRIFSRLVNLEQLESISSEDRTQSLDQRRNLERLEALIHRLKPLDREIILLYLEDTDAASIGNVTGLSPANVAMKIHRIKKILARQFQEGGDHAQ